jgi:ubiquinone/menaquinone biosynthesis C-methylase UbiE
LSKKDNLANEWDDAIEPWADFVRHGKDFYRDELNNPAFFNLLGNVRGQLVLDLACGEGYNTRIIAKKGARVTGVDFSTKMIELARLEEKNEKLDIDYYVSDAANLRAFPNNHFDLVTCFMALQDIESYEKAVREVARVLKSKGRFIFSIPHPCFEIIVEEGNRISATARYFGAAKYPIEWRMERLLKPFRTTSFHRTLTEYSHVLFNSNLFISRLVEPQPTEKGLQKHPPLKEVLLRPQSIIIESIKHKKA